MLALDGLGTGFINAGFNIVSANDVWKPAGETYMANHPNTKYIIEDIAKVTGDLLLKDTNYKAEDIDVIIGGPPCQGFSTLGKRFIDDPRNKLFKEYIRIVNEIRPKVFVMENVSGILSMQGGKVLKNILKSFREIGYKVEFKLLNAAEYGVPQLRERTIFIGTRLDINIRYPAKKFSLLENEELPRAISFKDATSDLPLSEKEEITTYLTEPQNEYQRWIRGNCKKILNHKPPIHNEKARDMMRYIPEGSSAWEVELPEQLRPTSGFGNTYARLDSKQPGMTITRNYSCISSSRCIHPFVNRGLTAREAARIQSFPDNYIFKGSKTDIEIEIGNSVPPVLGEAIGVAIKEMLNSKQENAIRSEENMEMRNRASGWKYAKNSGHANEAIIANLMTSDEKYQKAFLSRLGKQNATITNVEIGGLCEKDVESVFDGEKTKSKTDMKIFLDDGSQYNISIKKSLSGQVYLIGIERFISGFEKQYDKEIPEDIKRAIRIFWGNAEDTTGLIDKFGTNKKYEYRKNRLVADTLKIYSVSLYNELLKWFVENIYEIADFCFSKGLARDKSEWANLVWYINGLGENQVDEMFNIDEICNLCKDVAINEIKYGNRGRRNNNSITFWICSMA